jgi:deazaflavin-dependent oxidoreductase (nitroreductase family)
MSKPGYTAPDLALVGQKHIDAYRDTGGETGYLWNGVPTLLLTVTGRRTGEEHTSALIFARDGEDYLVVASMGGAPRNPAWYLNLQANPRAHVQVKDQHFAVTAHTASPADKPRLWQIVRDVWPNYDAYQARTDRDIPVVVLRPT